MTMGINNNKLLSMKKILINIGFFIGLFAVLSLNACKEEIDPIAEELDFDRAFAPLSFSASISNGTTVTFDWLTMKNIDHYVLEIYSGVDFTTGTLIESTDIDSNLTTYSVMLPGDTEFVARIKAVSALEGISDSKWSADSFATDPENLFKNYVTTLTDVNSCVIRWTPGSSVTGLVFDNGTTETPYTISSAEMATGEKNLTGVANDEYEIRLMYNAIVRGKVDLQVEGDILLPAGGDLTTAIDAMTAGQILLLVNGETYGLTEVDTVTTSIKLRGLNATETLPVIYLKTGGGNHMFDIGTGMTLSDSLVFENVDITGYYDNAGAIRHRGIMDQELDAFYIGAIKFIGCILRNSGRSAIRLRGNAAGQIINDVEFNNCIMYDFAWDSHYGVLNGALTGNFINIKFLNTTMYNLRGGIINYGSGAGCLSAVVDNCSINQVTMDAASARYFIDFGTGTNTSTGTITISDCIFGQVSAVANGVRNSTMNLSVTGSYYTSDYVPVSGSITASMTAYAGASTALWKAPSTGDFTFLDANFAGKRSAGAPRWIE